MNNMYALIRNGYVLEIKDLTQEEYRVLIKTYDNIVDITDLNPIPEIGWVLSGNKIIELPLKDRLAKQQLEQREFGTELVMKLIDMVGTKNLELSATGSTVNVSSILTSLNSIMSLLQTGALKTARGLLVYYKPSFTVYQDVFQFGVDEITKFLTERGWE
jgi:hypothetical protein